MFYNKSKLSKLKDLRADTFKNFLDVIGRDSTTNVQLTAWAKKLGIQNLQVVMIDEIKNCSMEEPINIIVNNETSEEKGAHWSCYHQDKKTVVLGVGEEKSQ